MTYTERRARIAELLDPEAWAAWYDSADTSVMQERRRASIRRASEAMIGEQKTAAGASLSLTRHAEAQGG